MSEEKEVTEQKLQLLQTNFRFIMLMVFVPVIILVSVFGISFIFVAVMSGELPTTDALTQIVKDLLTFFGELLKTLLGG